MDFSGGLRANRVFMETVTAPNPLFVNIFMTFVEMLKVTPSGVDMADLRLRVHTPTGENVPKQTFSRWIQLMNGATEKRSLLNYKLSDKVLIRLEPSDNDPRAKKMVLTDEGLALAKRMSHIGFERQTIDHQLKAYRDHIDWLNSEEMAHARSLFEAGHTIDEVDKLMTQWKKDNPEKTQEWKNTTVLEFPVPNTITEAWFAEFHRCFPEDGENANPVLARKMMAQALLPVDDILERMMYFATDLKDGKVQMKISKSMYEEKGTLSAIITKMVAKAKQMEILARHGWHGEGLEFEHRYDEKLNIREYVLVTKPEEMKDNRATGLNDIVQPMGRGIRPLAAEPVQDESELVQLLKQQLTDAKEREEKLLARIDKLTEIMMEKKP